jgi:hypothetical protein
MPLIIETYSSESNAAIGIAMPQYRKLRQRLKGLLIC